ncbi:hypothetical protein OROGR_021112 [Orobanche gracilis]
MRNTKGTNKKEKGRNLRLEKAKFSLLSGGYQQLLKFVDALIKLHQNSSGENNHHGRQGLSRGFDSLRHLSVVRWDAIENKPTVITYGGGAVVGVWLAAIVVGAVDSIPLLPKIMELVGLGYTGWFVYRYLLFESGRKELATDIEDIKKKIAGRHKACDELKKWTDIGWSKNDGHVVDVEGEKWDDFVKSYEFVATMFLMIPLQNETEWDKLLHSGYAKGDRSYTPSICRQTEGS